MKKEELLGKIEAEIENMEKEAYINTHFRFILALDKKGELESIEGTAGGSDMLASVFNGDAVELHEACHQCYDIVHDGYQCETEQFARDCSEGKAEEMIFAFCKNQGIEVDEIVAYDYFHEFVNFVKEEYQEEYEYIRDTMVSDFVGDEMPYIMEGISDQISTLIEGGWFEVVFD